MIAVETSSILQIVIHHYTNPRSVYWNKVSFMIWQFIISLGCESQTFIQYLYMQYCVFSHQKRFESSQSTYSYARSGCNTSRVNSRHFLVLTNKYKYVTLQTGTMLLRSYRILSVFWVTPPPPTKKRKKRKENKWKKK